ncbi:hypothetical protein HGRIS_011509 [Hohenbuehelia grisea]|uniref:Enoyl reductase (ER) domain-containing protein n=1 Tax=Hohenbuehelia grisea TaxID=104357 RepID=A0ABR3JVJ2_9AGAR
MSPAVLPSHKAAVLYGQKDLRIEHRTAFPPQRGHAQVQLIATGLCGSDLHYYQHGRNGDFALRAPLVLGHESAGVVTALGPGVKNLKVGQRVAIEAGINCATCNYCKTGRYNLCKDLRFASSAKTFPHLDGTLQDRMSHPAHLLHPLPDNCTFDHGALAEPLSVIIHSSRRASLAPGQSVLVFGAGTIGLLACLYAKAHGASHVVAVDINPARLDFALANSFCDAVHCLAPAERPKGSEEQLRRASETAASVLEAFKHQQGFDLVYECTGAEPCIQMAIHVAALGGTVMLIGMGTRSTTLPLSAAATREVDVLGSFRYANTYPQALAMLAEGKLEGVEKLVTHRFGLDETRRAFEMMGKGVDEQGQMVIKVVIGTGEQ